MTDSKNKYCTSNFPDRLMCALKERHEIETLEINEETKFLQGGDRKKAQKAESLIKEMRCRDSQGQRGIRW